MKTEHKPITAADVNMVMVASQIIRDRQAWVVGVNVGSTSFHVDKNHLLELAQVMGGEIVLTNRGPTEYPWYASFKADGFEFYAVLKPDQLYRIGYHVPDHSQLSMMPVKIA